MTEYLNNNSLNANIIYTVALLIMALIIRFVALSAVRRMGTAATDSLRTWIVQIRNMTFILVGFGLFLIWSGEIKGFAFSVAAVAVAFVIGTKELLMCFTGGLLKAGSRAFRIGDRIEVAGFRGDVVDMNFFTTTIFEIGPGHILHQYTGRKLVIPNSLFLNHAVTNESFTAKYFFHTFTVPLSIHDDWEHARDLLLKKANEECSGFLEDSRHYITRIGRIEGLDTPNVNPRVSLHVSSPDEIQLLVRIPSPPHKQGPMEQAIIEKFLRDLPKINRNRPGIEHKGLQSP